jgi:hemerythrin-like metal-binding protein
MVKCPTTIATDIDVADLQFKRIFELSKAFATCLRIAGPSERLVLLTLRALLDYSNRYFPLEEAVMASANVDPRHVSRHKTEHRSFIYDIEKFTAQMAVVTKESVEEVSRKLLRFMAAWLTHHIVGMDHSMAAQIGAIKGGLPSGTAFTLQIWRDSRSRCRQLAETLMVLTERSVFREGSGRLAA